MHRPRFYCPDMNRGSVSLDDTEGRHARDVLRVRVDDRVELFDGHGGLAMGVIEHVGRKQVTVWVDVIADPQPAPRCRVLVVVSIPKRPRQQMLVEKLTELGVTDIVGMDAIHTASGGSANDADLRKWRRWSIDACKQCGRLFLPTLTVPASLDTCIEMLPADGVCLAGDAQGLAILDESIVADVRAADSVTLVIGPESGFTATERSTLADAGCRMVRMGASTLRIETAAIALSAAITAILDSHSAA